MTLFGFNKRFTTSLRGFLWTALVTGGCVLPVSHGFADFVKSGDQFAINLSIDRDQTEPRVDIADNGNFVVVWESFSHEGVDDDATIARLFDSSGNPFSGEILVHTRTGVDQRETSVTMNRATGGFIVVWESSGQVAEGSSWDIFARTFDAAGNPVSDEILVNENSTDQQKYSNVAVDPNSGSFVVVWQSLVRSDFDVFFRRFDLQGNPLGGEVKVNTAETGDHFNARIGMDGQGNFTVVWEARYDNNSDILFRRFDASGNPLSGEVSVATNLLEEQNDPDIEVSANGGMIIIWDSSHLGDLHIFAQRFDATGAPVGSEIQIDDTPEGNNARVAIDDAGNFVAVWEGSDGESDGIFARAFTNAGEAVGASFVVNTVIEDLQGLPDLAINGSGANLVFVWETLHAGGQSDVHAQLYVNTFGSDVEEAMLHDL